ncbi:G-protein coupled receptor moody [Hylaeus volcanicus]|uniref:G-protein coupled receptor moody n=1 Tax=Hylaeus volcanicus TaxID=313075 RepID=UPI0023B7EB4D|nr:G-protein coupled receptor moody [Hylaeus volcanicus]XP_053978296.1 G-protein coupled receptor moody [Hylaeus volcanicus]XP_053978297.1 G-protein coupled receptor moody [Hylaeus volcanicus]
MEYWMASNETGQNGRAEVLEEVLQDPGSAILFVGYPRWLLHLAASCCVFFMLVGIPGNLFTIIALYRTKKLRNATTIFILNLSVSDLMFCCFNLPLATSTFWHSSWRHGALLCRLFPLMRYGLVAVSLFTILAITINRYVMIGHPRLYPTLYKPKYLLPVVLSIWIIAFGVLVVTWFESWGRFGLDTAIGSCSILPDVHGRSPKEFLFVVAFLTPCVAIVVCYARIFYIVRRTACKTRRRNIATRTDNVKAYSRNQEEELSALESSCTASVLCANFSSKRSITPPNRPKSSRTPSRSAIEETLSELQPSWQQDEKEDEEESEEEAVIRSAESEILRKKNTKKMSNKHDEFPSMEIVEVYEKVCPDFGIKLDDIPYVDERDDLDAANDIFTNNDRSAIKELPVKATANSRNKLERMASRASFIIESALWVQRLNSKTSTVNDRLESVTSSSHERSTTRNAIDRSESGLKSVGRSRNSLAPPRMSSKDKKLLKMILVIFSSFLVCYLPITVTKTFKNAIDWRGLNIAGYILIYLTTCINPVVYVVMSSEYRSAYKNVLLCRHNPDAKNEIRRP